MFGFKFENYFGFVETTVLNYIHLIFFCLFVKGNPHSSTPEGGDPLPPISILVRKFKNNKALNIGTYAGEKKT
jgi:hypothetical protein